MGSPLLFSPTVSPNLAFQVEDGMKLIHFSSIQKKKKMYCGETISCKYAARRLCHLGRILPQRENADELKLCYEKVSEVITYIYLVF